MHAAPRWFTPVAVAALLWNLLGCVAFIADLRLTPDDIAHLSAAQQVLYQARAGWAIAATGIAVIGGALGSLGLLMRRRWASGLLIASLLGVLVQDIGLWMVLESVRAAGSVSLLLQGMVLLVAMALVPLAGFARARGWTA